VVVVRGNAHLTAGERGLQVGETAAG